MPMTFDDFQAGQTFEFGDFSMKLLRAVLLCDCDKIIHCYLPPQNSVSYIVF